MHGVSTWKVDDQEKARGVDAISKSETSRIFSALDTVVAAVRALTDEHRYPWIAATSQKVCRWPRRQPSDGGSGQQNHFQPDQRPGRSDRDGHHRGPARCTPALCSFGLALTTVGTDWLLPALARSAVRRQSTEQVPTLPISAHCASGLRWPAV